MSIHYTDLEPALLPERLDALAEVLVRVRDEANSLHESEAGETNLTRGTRTYERARKAFRDLARTVDWLEVNEIHNAVVLEIDGVPLKFHRADPEEASARVKGRHWLELNPPLPMDGNPLLAERDARRDSTHHWRLFYETNKVDERISVVHLVRYDEDNSDAGRWDVPLRRAPAVVVPLAEQREAPELDQPAVGPLTMPEEKADGLGG